MSNIQWVRDLLKTCPVLENAARVAVGELMECVDYFSIDPLPGGGAVEEYLDGSKLMEFPFTVSSCQCSADEGSRLDSNGVFEALCEWMEQVTEEEAFPPMAEGKCPERIEATGWGYVFQKEDDPSTAIYQISGKLVYSIIGHSF